MQHQRLDDEALTLVESLIGALLADASPSDAAAIIAADVAMRTEVRYPLTHAEPDSISIGDGSNEAVACGPDAHMICYRLWSRMQ